MSNRALNWAFAAPIMGAPKWVLVALANDADGDCKCFPAVSRLMLHAGLSDRGVQLALRQLEAMGAIKTERKSGHRSTYVLALNHVFTPELRSPLPPNVVPPEQASPPNVVPPFEALTPENSASDPRTTFTQSLREPKKERKEKEVRDARETRRTKLSDDWQPSESGVAFATEKNLDPALMLAQFSDYHIARGNRMLNWDRAWQTWCRNAVDFAKRRGPQPSGEYRNGFLEIIRREGMPSIQPQPEPNPVLAIFGKCSNG